LIIDEFQWKPALAQLLAATLNQQTLEEAAELMVSVSAVDRSYHKECLSVFDEALGASASEDDFVIACVNKSGYKVDTRDDANEILGDFRAAYLQEYQRATGVVE
jgi:hypothetical protein